MPAGPEARPRGRSGGTASPGSGGSRSPARGGAGRPAPGPRGCREEDRCPHQGDPAVERQGEGQRKRRKSRESQRR